MRGRRTDTETHDEERNAREGQLHTLTELLRNGINVRTDDTGVEGDDQARYRHHEGAVPLPNLGPVLRVVRVVRLERHHAVSVTGLAILPRRAGDLALPRLNAVLLHVGAIGEGAVGKAEVELRVAGRLRGLDGAGTGEPVEARRAVVLRRAVGVIVDPPRGVALLVGLEVGLEGGRVPHRVGGGPAGGVVPVGA